jgi:hypothetical protein
MSFALDFHWEATTAAIKRTAHRFDPAILYYHASRHADEITQFLPFTHFGVAQAANDRSQGSVFHGAQQVCVYEVRLHLDPARLLRIPDLCSEVSSNAHSMISLTDSLRYEHEIISSADRDRVFKAAEPSCLNEQLGLQELARILTGMGYDGIVYTNEYEAPGSDSVIIIRPEQAEIVRRLTIEGFSANFFNV